MIWTAVVPLKHRAERKTRLAGRRAPDTRARLADVMAMHAFNTLARADGIGQIVCLSPVPLMDGAIEWRPDHGRGLNAELRALRFDVRGPLLVIHADLPLVSRVDVETLLGGAAGRSALAPDRHGAGTNAIALLPGQPLEFAFGTSSFLAHVAAMPGCAIIERVGLGLDIDTPDDLDAARALGFAWPEDIEARPVCPA